MMNFQLVIKHLFEKIKILEEKGHPAAYIPELARVSPDHFGVHLSTLAGSDFGIGDYQEVFSIQSISKVFTLALAYKYMGENIWTRLGVEPSGTRFNSLVQLESDNGIPRNPFINSGALVVADILLSQLNDPRKDLLAFIRSLCSQADIRYNSKIALSEKSVGYRNVALCNFIKSFGNLENEPEQVLDFYFDLCSLECSCQSLSNLFLFLANNGRALHSREQILSKSQAKRINAIMQTCGFYDESGEFAFKVGLPGKSGVGGGIVAVHPGQYSIAIWSPGLNTKGNSWKGIQFLEAFTTETEQSIF